jgi:type IV pilus assembly protein PilZ
VIEQRRYARTPVGSRLSFTVKGGHDAHPGVARDISLGGVFVETDAPAPFNADVVIRVALPGSTEELTLPGRVRWVNADGMGVQFGLIGARETFLITELTRKDG